MSTVTISTKREVQKKRKMCFVYCEDFPFSNFCLSDSFHVCLCLHRTDLCFEVMDFSLSASAAGSNLLLDQNCRSVRISNFTTSVDLSSDSADIGTVKLSLPADIVPTEVCAVCVCVCMHLCMCVCVCVCVLGYTCVLTCVHSHYCVCTGESVHIITYKVVCIVTIACARVKVCI